MQINIKFKPTISKFQGRFSKKSLRLKKALDIVVKKSAYLIEGESKKKTPVDTGRLKSSIQTKLKTMEAIIMPKTDYAIYVHEGTYKMKARSFMKWGIEASEHTIRQILQTEVHKALK